MKKTERKLPEAPAVPVNPAEREKIEEQLRRQARIMNLLWSVSLIVIGVGTFILSVTNIAGIELPDLVVRVLGAANLAALPVMIFATVKKMKLRADAALASVQPLQTQAQDHTETDTETKPEE